jgi:hypothetical protein
MVLFVNFPPINMTEHKLTEEVKKVTPIEKYLLTSLQNKPQIPDEVRYPIFGLIPRPKTNEEKLITTTASWSLVGFFVGTCNGISIFLNISLKLGFMIITKFLSFNLKSLFVST